MAALHGYAQFLQTVDTPEQGKAASDGLLHEVRNLSEMTTAFLNFARPQALQLEEISVDELIEDCVGELKPLLEARHVACVRNATVREGEETSVHADPRLLRQALLNVIRNAIEAIPDGASDRQVSIESSQQIEPHHRWVIVLIQDTGPGIAPEDIQKIFIPFFTTKTKGHGIGLALAHRVITEHGGTLTATNASGGGAVFTVRLPLS
jgi:signal transduction histidine kinase